jgi:hypothetical protein
MKRIVIALGASAALALAAVTPGLAHQGGHQGGCEDFGHLNRQIGQNPGDFGFPNARNLGDIVSSRGMPLVNLESAMSSRRSTIWLVARNSRKWASRLSGGSPPTDRGVSAMDGTREAVSAEREGLRSVPDAKRSPRTMRRGFVI